MICRTASEEAREPSGETPTSLDRTDLFRTAAVGPMLVDRDLAANELLVDRLGRLLDVVLRQRVLGGRRLTLADRRADRERQPNRVDDPVEEQLTLCRLELLRILLCVGERLQVALELLAHGRQHRL
jgi:hypothetical protein